MELGQGLGLSQKMLFDSLLSAPTVAPFLGLKREKIEDGIYITNGLTVTCVPSERLLFKLAIGKAVTKCSTPNEQSGAAQTSAG
jgi:hypothetical protein